MSKLNLVLIDKKYSKQCEDYKQNMLDNDSNMDGCGNLRTLPIDLWIKESLDHHNGINIPENRVPATQLLAIDENNKVVGMLQIRHSLGTEYLKNCGGHIGYSVRCDERLKGYAKQMLNLSFKWCQDLGINKILITCKKENIGSSKTIIANGGLFESEVQSNDIILNRYWINI